MKHFEPNFVFQDACFNFKHKMQDNNQDANKQLAEVSAQVVALKERVQALEAIVTDSSYTTKEEINRL